MKGRAVLYMRRTNVAQSVVGFYSLLRQLHALALATTEQAPHPLTHAHATPRRARAVAVSVLDSSP
jgi:hypothetical protein